MVINNSSIKDIAFVLKVSITPTQALVCLGAKYEADNGECI
ncbi:hypothetical protein [Xenorhabdus sp. KK7.4]|nr:hypothetical protein [Xenorhabdus sp. KK7.4]PHM58617.1 hypothetical protein Xekk_01192 [Xenorhabdus sp. KK7.4]